MNSIVLKLLFCFLGINVIATAQAADIEFSRDSQNLILSLTETHGIMTGDDSVTTLKVYGNGLVKVHYPLFMKKAGYYQMMLDDDSLNELLQSFAEKKIPEFDLNAVEYEKKNKILQAKQASQPELFAVFDASVTTIEMNFDRYTKQLDTPVRSDGSENSLSVSLYEVIDLKKKISWEGIRADSKRFPNIEGIQNLSTAHRMLLDLKESKQLIKSEQLQ